MAKEKFVLAFIQLNNPVYDNWSGSKHRKTSTANPLTEYAYFVWKKWSGSVDEDMPGGPQSEKSYMTSTRGTILPQANNKL